MLADCHMHAVLDGVDWRAAIGRHREKVNEEFIHQMLNAYRAAGFDYLRDGGDRWCVGKRAREIAPDYGIVYRTPLANLCKAGHYGSFIGEKYADFKEFAELVRKHRADGADFIKIMISGLMDFNVCGRLTEEPLDGETIRELIHIAHEEGMAVMAHANGARTIEAAAAAGVDSIEHGAYQDADSLAAMAEMGTVWVPTLSTIGNLRGKGRFDERAVAAILEGALESVSQYQGLVAPGTDAGAWAVPHGSDTEETLLAMAGMTAQRLAQGVQVIQNKF